MAKFEELGDANRIKNTDEAWNGKSGMQVEDFLCRKQTAPKDRI